MAITEKPQTGRQAYYAMLYPVLLETAKTCGYTLCIHGSMARDLDLVAVPWEEVCAEPSTLAAALAFACGGYIKHDGDGQPWARYDDRQSSFARRPHGRVCAIIMLAGSAYIDLSIVEPRHRKAEPDA